MVVVHQAMPHLGVFAVGFDVAVPAIGLVDGDDVDGVGGGEGSVAFDDDQVVVICVGRLEAEVVRARHHHGIFAERIEHDDLAVDVDHAGAEEFLFPGVELFLDVPGHEDIVTQAQRRLDGIIEQGDRVLDRGGGVERGVRLLLARLRRAWLCQLGYVLVDDAAEIQVGVVVGTLLVVALKNVLKQRPVRGVLLESSGIEE